MLNSAWMGQSGDYVRNEGIFQHSYFILQPQLALLEPGKLQLVGDVVDPQRFDRRIQVAMCFAQRQEP